MFDSIYTFFHSDDLMDCTNQEKKEKCISFLKESMIQKYRLPFFEVISFEDFLLLLEKKFPNQRQISNDVIQGILFIMKCMQGVTINVEYGVTSDALFTGDMIRTIIFSNSNTGYENVLYVYHLFRDSFFGEKSLLKCLR